MTRHPSPAQRGFSLVELLVVISLIALLASMLMPALKAVRDSARTVVCANNLRQFQTANLAYSNDNGGCFVPSYRQDPDGQQRDTWMDNEPFVLLVRQDLHVVSAATKASQLLKKQLCPLSKANPTTSAVASSYGYNYPNKNRPPSDGSYAIPYATMNAPGSKVAFADALDWGLTYGKSDPGSYWSTGLPSPEGAVKSAVAYRHRSLANVVFYDGHVTAMHWTDLYLTANWY